MRTRWPAMPTDDPWAGLDPDGVDSRRVDAAGRWEFFWSCSRQYRQMLSLKLSAWPTPPRRLPKLRSMAILNSNAPGTPALLVALTDPSCRELFARLCRDVVLAAEQAESEEAALDRMLARLGRWRHLLRGGGDGLLPPEAQCGLIGELTVLGFLLDRLDPAAAVRAWTGPLDAPKDFEIGAVCIESKARRGQSKPSVRISSAAQLDDGGLDALFLHVLDLDRTPEPDGVTVVEVARVILRRLSDADTDAALRFDELLAATGLRCEDDYREHRWRLGSSRFYAVRNGFPRITAVMIGINDVIYSIALTSCSEFEVSASAVSAAIVRGSDDERAGGL